MKPLITNIQRFCLHDGPGIRTTVFFKGCTLHCPWCANPENINNVTQKYGFSTDSGKGSTLEGRWYSDEELYELLYKDEKFYRLNNGGITFSGGEPLLNIDKYEKMIDKFRHDNISICVETAMFVPEECCNWAVEHVDYFFVDLKILDSQICQEVLGGNVSLFIKNLKRLYQHVPKDNIIYRVPLVPDLTYTENNLKKIKRIIEKYPPASVEIFSVHNLGQTKYEKLGLDYSPFQILNQAQLETVKCEIEKCGVEIKINKI